ncbi:alpha/beta-hydrolase [Microthyrium microscopicum]|uniref:Alpha/beta-hydrolase n=1 Tax=Microthyrium microscopicum TaxID=703497 RepID=A0A6A6U7P1_9PEZI|nr:alpha/beta-hydrolase [Microthyrium microscopicum]
MANKLPTIVLVHGAFHVPAAYEPLTSILESSGYRVSAPHLPSTEDIPAIASMDPDVETIRSAVLKELGDGQDVVMFLHSYGGVPGSEALRGLSKSDRKASGEQTGVIAIVCGGANLLEEGEALSDHQVMEPKVAQFYFEQAMKDGDGYLRVSPEDAVSFFYGSQSPDVISHVGKLLKPWAMGVSMTKTTYAAWRHIPTTYIFSTEDKSMIPESFERILGKKKVDGTTPAMEVVTLEGADHSPFLDRPDVVANVIRRVAGETEIAI